MYSRTGIPYRTLSYILPRPTSPPAFLTHHYVLRPTPSYYNIHPTTSYHVLHLFSHPTLLCILHFIVHPSYFMPPSYHNRHWIVQPSYLVVRTLSYILPRPTLDCSSILPHPTSILTFSSYTGAWK